MQYKTCTKCGKELPATEEYFIKQKKWLSGYCRECFNKERRDKYSTDEEQRNKIRQQANIYRQNNIEVRQQYCREYYKDNREELLSYKKKYYEENKESKQIYNQNYYYKHREKLLEDSKKYRVNKIQQVREYDRKRSKEKYQQNKEYYNIYSKNHYELNKAARLLQIKEWRENNKNLTRLYTQKYQAKKKSLLFTLTPEQWQYALDYFNNGCAYCGLPAEQHIEEYNQRINQDHFIPVENGGDYTHNNIVPACKSCNSSKQDKDFLEWYPQQPYYSKERERKILDFLGYQQGIQQLTIAL